MPHSAIISGDFKVMHFYGSPDIPMLFDLSGDIGEVTNIANSYRKIHETMYDDMMEYLKKYGARFPKMNPNFDPQSYKAAREFRLRTSWGPFEGRRTLDDDEI